MIICAAISVSFTKEGREVKAVIPGYRHANCWELMATLGVPSDRQEIEGFLNHKGEFLDRSDAYDHALMCGQLSDTTLTSKQERRERILYSEDLY